MKLMYLCRIKPPNARKIQRYQTMPLKPARSPIGVHIEQLPVYVSLTRSFINALHATLELGSFRLSIMKAATDEGQDLILTLTMDQKGNEIDMRIAGQVRDHEIQGAFDIRREGIEPEPWAVLGLGEESNSTSVEDTH